MEPQFLGNHSARAVSLLHANDVGSGPLDYLSHPFGSCDFAIFAAAMPNVPCHYTEFPTRWRVSRNTVSRNTVSRNTVSQPTADDQPQDQCGDDF